MEDEIIRKKGSGAMKTTILGIKKVLTQYENIGKFITVKNKKQINKDYLQVEKERVFFNKMIETIKEADAQIERGEGRDADEVLEEWKEKYGWQNI